MQLWKLAQSRLALSCKAGGDVVDRSAIQIGDLPATTFLHDDMEDQVGVGVIPYFSIDLLVRTYNDMTPHRSSDNILVSKMISVERIQNTMSS